MTDIEKANAETDKANQKIAELEGQIKNMQVKAKLAELGITGEQADNFFAKDGTINFEVLSQVISEREKLASALKEKEILKDTPNPNGAPPDGTGNESEAEKIAKEIGQNMAKTNKVTSDVIAHYANS